jgi:hypothetical protein
MDVLGNIAIALIAFYGGAWTAGRMSDRDRYLRSRDTAVALRADLGRVRAQLGGPESAVMLSGTPSDRPRAPGVHRWVDGLIVSLSSDDPALIALYMKLDEQLALLDIMATRWHEARDKERRAFEQMAELEEQKATDGEAEVEMDVLGLVMTSEEVGGEPRWVAEIEKIRRYVQSVSEAEEVAKEWHTERSALRRLFGGLEASVFTTIATIESALSPIAARQEMSVLPGADWAREMLPRKALPQRRVRARKGEAPTPPADTAAGADP